MNGAKKFHKPDGPAFNEGEIWYSADGMGIEAKIERTERYGVDKWDVMVYYSFPRTGHDNKACKDAWNFQVRYEHQADLEI
jgi:hypothetical protein